MGREEGLDGREERAVWQTQQGCLGLPGVHVEPGLWGSDHLVARLTGRGRADTCWGGL